MRIEDYKFRSDIALRGKAEGVATALLKILAARDLHLTEEQKTQILGCTDLDLLDTWLDRVLQGADVDDLLH